MDMRKVELFKNDEWREIDFKQLKEGDKFRVFESTGEKVIDPKGHSEWIASCPAFIGQYGDLTINVYSS